MFTVLYRRTHKEHWCTLVYYISFIHTEHTAGREKQSKSFRLSSTAPGQYVCSADSHASSCLMEICRMKFSSGQKLFDHCSVERLMLFFIIHSRAFLMAFKCCNSTLQKQGTVHSHTH